MKMNDAVIARFWAKVEVGEPEDCWIWTASMNSTAGQARLSGRTVSAHRVAFFLANGRWPSQCRRTCRNKRCVNPRHLVEGPGVPTACPHCETVFLRRHVGQTTCRSCKYVEVACKECGAPCMARRRALKETACASCLRSVRTQNLRFGREHHSYNGGLTISRGRTYIKCRDGSQMAYYRGVMAAHLGRLLTSEEHIHHINGDYTDDRLENLMLTDVVEHARLHAGVK